MALIDRNGCSFLVMHVINHFIFYRVTDGENPVESVELTVSVNDVNEPPVFTETTKTVEVHSDQTPPQPVTTMAGTDVDSGDSITYAITSNTLLKIFKGTLRVLPLITIQMHP